MDSSVDIAYGLPSNVQVNSLEQSLKPGATAITACLNASAPSLSFAYNQWSSSVWQQCSTDGENSDLTSSESRCCSDQSSRPDELRPARLGTIHANMDPGQIRTPAYQLVIVKQPEEQHRATRYGDFSSHTIKLNGYYRPTRVEMFAALGAGDLLPHPYYQLIPVSGKTSNITRCKKIVAQDGCQCLEVVLRPENQMIATLDCVGILKILTYDSRNKRQSRNACNLAHSSVRIAFRAYIPNGDGFNVLRAETEAIRCVQSLGVPEVLKMSLSSAPSTGQTELFIIGRNFDPRSTSVLFREYKDDGNLDWTAEAALDKQLLHQCHIVCTIPAYHNPHRGGNVSVTVRCGSKSSHPLNFLYTPMVQQIEDEWCPPTVRMNGEFPCASRSEQMEDCDDHNGKRSYIPFFESEFASNGMFSRLRNSPDAWDPNLPSASGRFNTDSSNGGDPKRRRMNYDM